MFIYCRYSKSTMSARQNYAVVQTMDELSSTRMMLHVVPTGWLIEDMPGGGSTLYYPPASLGAKTIMSIIVSGASSGVINREWKRYAAIVRMRCNTYAEAEQHMVSEAMATTVNDEQILNRLLIIRRRIKSIYQGLCIIYFITCTCFQFYSI